MFACIYKIYKHNIFKSFVIGLFKIKNMCTYVKKNTFLREEKKVTLKTKGEFYSFRLKIHIIFLHNLMNI